LALKIVERIPLMAEKNLVEVEISSDPIPILYRNQLDTLKIRASRKITKEMYKETLKNINLYPLTRWKMAGC
jgi:hypothetical protein